MNWPAVGAIATAVAVMVALYVNYRTNRLQILLLRQQRAQEKLDEMVQNVMQLRKNMNTFDIMYYSSKFKDDTFTVEDRRVLEHLTEEYSAKAADLTLQMEMLKNHESAKPMLDYFWEIWEDYGLWSISISTLFQYMSASQEVRQESNVVALTEKIVHDMKTKLVEIDRNYRAVLAEFLKDKDVPIVQAQAIMEMFGVEMTKLIQRKCAVLSNKVIEFVRIEQERIDAMAK